MTILGKDLQSLYHLRKHGREHLCAHETGVSQENKSNHQHLDVNLGTITAHGRQMLVERGKSPAVIGRASKTSATPHSCGMPTPLVLCISRLNLPETL